MRVGTNSGGTGSNRCFYSGPKQPITPEANPYKLFDMLFAGRPTGGMPDPGVDKIRAERKSLLDFVGKSLEKFRGQLGMEDRVVIEGHLNSIRNIETELTTPAHAGRACAWPRRATPAKPVDIASNNNNPVLLNVGFQLMTAALSCDVTRVATLQFGDATGGSVTFPVVNVGRNWHSLGHNPGADKLVVDKWCMTHVRRACIDMFKAVPEGTGKTMLDNSVIVWANHMESGDTHGATKLPWILAGTCGGYLKKGMSMPDDRARTTPTSWPPSPTPWAWTLQTFGDGAPMPELKA